MTCRRSWLGKTRGPGLATGGLGLLNHHPVVLAMRELATVDALSGGADPRLCVGDRCAEGGDRGVRADFGAGGAVPMSSVAVLRLLWQDRARRGRTSTARFFRFRQGNVLSETPWRTYRFTSVGTAVRRRGAAGRLGDGFQPLGVGGTDTCRAGLADARRGRALRTRSRCAGLSLGHLVTKIDGDRAARLEALGAHRVILAMPPTADIEEARDMLSACAERLVFAG